MKTTKVSENAQRDRLNNFDLIRLIAAIQVVLWHGIEHLHIKVPEVVLLILGSFPGVPIFFVVSGYLVTASYRRSDSYGQYLRNRALRIFPGLWVCFILTFLSIAWVYGLSEAGLSDISKWIIPNIFGVSHTPSFLRNFATGSVNGSLWTIPVELQFYLILPFMVVFLAQSIPRWMLTFSIFLIISNVYLHLIREESSYWVTNLAVRALPVWLYMFMIGMLLEFRRDLVQKFMANRFEFWFAAYTIFTFAAHVAGFNTTGNTISPLLIIPLAGLVISAAYSYRTAASLLLKHNDISYGVYLYHMPIINIIVMTRPDFMNGFGLALCIVLTGLAATMSWALIEKPVLRRKVVSRPKFA